MPPPLIVVIVATADPTLVGDILDLVTGKTAAALAAVTAQTEADLHKAQGLDASLATKE